MSEGRVDFPLQIIQDLVMVKKVMLSIAMLTLAMAGTVSATADPPHNVTVDRLIANGPGTDSTSCSVLYQHGNVWAVGYAKITRGTAATLWPTTSTTYAPSGKRYGWGLTYPSMPDGVPIRCNFTGVTVGVLWNGQILEYYNEGSGTSWVQAQGPVYSSIIGSTGWVGGPVATGGGQALANQYFPGF